MEGNDPKQRVSPGVDAAYRDPMLVDERLPFLVVLDDGQCFRVLADDRATLAHDLANAEIHDR